MKKFVLALLLVLLPLQTLAAIIAPLSRQDVTAATAHDHGIRGGHLHDHDAPAHDQEHAFTATSDHCGTGCAFAIPMTSAAVLGASGSTHAAFIASRFSGHIPEQPQRPPLA